MNTPTIRSLGLIHTVGDLQATFQSLTDELLPGVHVTNVVDESLLQDAIAEGGLTAEIETRLTGYVNSLVNDGVDAVLVTCSSMGQAVDRIAQTLDVPVLRVDAAMAESAVTTADRVGVLATLRTTMTPTVDLVRERATATGRTLEVLAHLCTGAFEALRAGDVDRHDALVRDGLREVEPRVDVVVLAQASMARVLLGPDVSTRVPVLSSPRLAIEALSNQGPSQLTKENHQ